MSSIKVLLIEDDPIWLTGLSSFINKQANMSIVGTASTKEEAMRLAKHLEFDVVLLDIMLTANNLDGLDLAFDFTRMGHCRIIMLTSLIGEDTILEAFASGAVNYINKTDLIEIPEAIRAAYLNRSFIHPVAAEVLRNESKRRKRKELDQLLTPAEKEILHWIQQGQTQSRIAELINIADQTVKNHINRILKKMKVRTSKEAAEIASKKGMI